jgi:N-acyl-D-amino-acid deacylase
MLEAVSQARARGVDVSMDQYPYTASSTVLSVLLPDWALENRSEGKVRTLRDRLGSKKLRAKIAAEMVTRIRDVLGREHLDYAVVSSAPWNRALEGKSLRDINRERHPAPAADVLEREVETVLEICQQGLVDSDANPCATNMVYHVMSEEDVEKIFADPRTMVARDGGIPDFGVGRPHPRIYGTCARVLSRFVREKGILSLEEAVRKMTSAPAERFGFRDRGLIREGFRADLVLFDPAVVADLATFEDPHQYSRGLDVVLVNGVVTRDGGKDTGERAGMVLTGPATVSGPVRASSPDTEPRPSSGAPPASRR